MMKIGIWRFNVMKRINYSVQFKKLTADCIEVKITGIFYVVRDCTLIMNTNLLMKGKQFYE
jgi:hypothetical protein